MNENSLFTKRGTFFQDDSKFKTVSVDLMLPTAVRIELIWYFDALFSSITLCTIILLCGSSLIVIYQEFKGKLCLVVHIIKAFFFYTI